MAIGSLNSVYRSPSGVNAASYWAPMPGMPMPPGSTKEAVWRCGFAQRWLIQLGYIMLIPQKISQMAWNFHFDRFWWRIVKRSSTIGRLVISHGIPHFHQLAHPENPAGQVLHQAIGTGPSDPRSFPGKSEWSLDQRCHEGRGWNMLNQVINLIMILSRSFIRI